MKKNTDKLVAWLLLGGLMLCGMAAPAQPLPADTIRVSKQCSLIRELVTLGLEAHFAPIRLQQTGSTHGYQPNGSWTFETLRYEAGLKWPGASRCYLEHYTDKTPAMEKSTWQYIAEYHHLSGPSLANRMYAYLSRQIEGCRFPVGDSLEADFTSLPADSLPADRPAMLETAHLYGLPALAGQAGATIHVMVGMEKRSATDYSVCLIVENLLNSEPGPRRPVKD